MINLTRRSAIAAGTASLASMVLGGPVDAQSRKILIIASSQDIPNFDPHIATGYSASMLLRNTYDSLVRVEGNPPNPVPHLATSWTVSPDGTEYVFKLDPAAKFHDGSSVTAEAVQYSFNRLLRLNQGNAWMIQGIVDEKSVQPVDAQTVRIKLVKPFVAFLQVLPWVWVVNPKDVEANKGSDNGQTYLRSNLAGSGAFRVRRAEPGNLYELERVANAWKQGGGNLTGAIWKITRETATQRLMLQRGEAHIAVDLTSEDMDAIKDRPNVVSVIEPEYRTFSIKLNTKHGPLADVNLRKAIAYAFNYQSLLDSGGYAKLMTGPLPDGIFGHDPSLQVYRTDLAKAKEYLAKSKYPNGGIKLSIAHVSGLEQQRRWSLVLLDNLKQLNIELDVKPMIWPDMVALTRSPEAMPDFFCVYQTANYGDPDNIAFAAYHSSRNGNWQNPVYANPKVDDLIMRARAETDEEKRKALYGEFQRIVVDDTPDIFGVIEKRKLALRSDVQNFRFTPVASNAIELFPLSLR
ncbi:ABC transporter substrate-binding protein [Microvirga alba]|uniref:ABC transporter substrate-binding protein n=1 Tax=Microvirga alba TaxID=2791025 RepID=A0A931BWP9_9HYPH|nr:ABC transporter substrate-binding protein [Microvirga alba]MBF9235240.1 ABC transporter substrate-binding protein [Microvirga alba]